MKGTLLALSAAGLLLAAPLAAAPPQQARVGRSLKNDTSPPLRSMRQIPPKRGPRDHEMPKPLGTPFEGPPPPSEAPAAPAELSPTPLALVPGTDFEGISNLSGVLPPDTNGDVGPDHYVQMVNSAFQIWDKLGNSLLGPSDLSTLWTGFGIPCAGTNDGDPVVLYDSLADRWLLSQFVAVAPYYGECIAVSQTGDPTGAYHRYYFALSTTVFYDYPHLGVWPDAYYMGTNKFNPSYVGSAVIAFEREQMLKGEAAQLREFATSSSGTPLPADLDGPTLPPPGAPNYIAQLGATLRIYQFHVDWSNLNNSTFTGPTSFTISYDLPCSADSNCVPQPDPPGPPNIPDLDTLQDRLMHRFAYRNFDTHESLVVNHTIKDGTGQSPVGVRWYEVRLPGGVPTLFQQGTYAPNDDTWRWMGSVAMDGSGNLGIGYSVSGDAVYPGIRYTGHLASDPVTSYQAEVTLQAGAGVQQHAAARWGDYSSMSIDPEDDCTFWYTNEYYSTTSSADWQTRIGAFDFGPGNCTPAPKGTIQGTVEDAGGVPIPGALVEASNGVSDVTDPAGFYSLTVSPGVYTVSASAADRTCAPLGPQNANVANGAVTVVDFVLGGDPLLAAIGTAVADSGGNNNGKVNQDECFGLGVTLRNDGCAGATGINATLATSTPGVTITQNASAYPNLAIAASGANTTAFAVNTNSVSFVCGNAIDFTLSVAGQSPIQFSVPTCQGTQTINGQITAGDLSMGERLGRIQPGSTCGNPKLCPGAFATAGTYRYDLYSFTNNGSDGCFTVTLNPGTCTGANQLHSSAYLTAFNAADVCDGFLADNGFDPTVTTNYSFELANGETAAIVVNETASGGADCTAYSLTIPAVDATSVGNCGGGAPVMTAAALVVDDAGNDVLEAGETAIVAPAWQNTGSAQATGLGGSAANLTGPVTTTYTLDDAAAAYGNVSVGATASCATGLDCYAVTLAAPADRTPRHWDATFDETLSVGLVGAKSWTLHVGESFADVPTAHGFYRGIETALHGGLSPGCDATGYCPDLPVTRRELAMFLLRGKEGGAYTPPDCPGPDPYGDVPAADPFCPWIQDAALNGYMSACDTAPAPDLFCPEGAVQRQQLAFLLLRTVEGSAYTPPACLGPDPYADVLATDPLCPWIQEIKSRGITLGCGGGNFCPLQPVTRSAMAALLGRGFGLALYTP